MGTTQKPHSVRCKEIISRDGSECVVRDKKGKLWLTRRKKLRHDTRRRKGKYAHVIHYPIHRILEKGDWIFTCSMRPLQFDRITPKKYDRSDFPSLTDEQFKEFVEDDFVTMEGSHHSKKHCSCKPISDEYAAFFIKHELWSLYFLDRDWDNYEQRVKGVCKIFNITYEGY